MGDQQGRGLSKQFRTDLRSGRLKPILRLVRRDATLCLQIREDYINIYYRGGNVLRISEESEGRYKAFFDEKYLGRKHLKPFAAPVPGLPRRLDDSAVQKWLKAMPRLKHRMDLYFGRHPKEEREAQQLLARENGGRRKGGSSDYLVCDIEYTNSRIPYARFDLVCVHWPSTPAKRKQNGGRRLVLMELKYGDTALRDQQSRSGKKKPGLGKHLDDLKKFLSEEENVKGLKKEMVAVFNQKRKLGLIDCSKDLASFSDEPPLYVLLLANHDPESRILHDELVRLQPTVAEMNPLVEVAVATSTFLGYRLYEQGICPFADFLKRYAKQVYSKSGGERQS